MKSSELFEIMKQSVRDAGFPVHLESPFCLERMARLNTCKGCESEQGCSRLSMMGEAALKMNDLAKRFSGFKEQLAASMALADIHQDIITNGVIKDNKKDGIYDKNINDLF